MSEPIRFAKISNGVVVDALVAEAAPSDTDDARYVALPYEDFVDEKTGRARRRYLGGIGWDYVDGQFVDNRPVEDDEI